MTPLRIGPLFVLLPLLQRTSLVYCTISVLLPPSPSPSPSPPRPSRTYTRTPAFIFIYILTCLLFSRGFETRQSSANRGPCYQSVSVFTGFNGSVLSYKRGFVP